jgi:aldose 1-epimerase
MEKAVFGHMPDGTPVYEIRLQNENFDISIISYGGAIRRFVAYGTDIICGFETLEGYLSDTSHQGALLGRYANRIDSGKFNLDGKAYQLDCNSGGGTVHLHGGFKGYSRKLWQVTDFDDAHVTLRMDSPDGDQGYPGHVIATVTYTLGAHGLCIDYTAVTDAPTPLNLSNHAYFNLNGCGSGSVLDTELQINADAISAYDEHSIPRGHRDIAGTPFDFTTLHPIGDSICDSFPTYDHNYILRGTPIEEVDGHRLPVAAYVKGKHCALTVYTDQPCLQFYIGYSLHGTTPFKGGAKQEPHTTISLEAQSEPDGPNRGEGILRPGETYRKTTLCRVDRI